jgi:hypothetical protein
MVMFDEKAQLHTLEGVAAATLILLVIIYAIDATSITPLTTSTSNAHVESELMTMGQDILNTLDYEEPGYNSQLKIDILNWSGYQYVWTGNDYIENGGYYPLNNSSLAQNLKLTLVSQGIAHRVDVVYLLTNTNNITGTSAPETMINAGEPSDNAVVISRKIVLQNTDKDNPLNNSQIRDIDTTSNLYNIVDIRLILWRI